MYMFNFRKKKKKPFATNLKDTIGFILKTEVLVISQKWLKIKLISATGFNIWNYLLLSIIFSFNFRNKTIIQLFKKCH